MKHTRLKAAMAALALSACTAAPDMTAIQAERARPVQRYDITQALASNGRVIVAGTQSAAVLVSDDQGQRWTRITLSGASMIGLAACPDGSFVGIDFHHQVWSSDAAGKSWASVKLERPGVPLALTCDPKGRWWVAGSQSVIAMSDDRGAHWTVIDGKEDAQITALQFVDANVGYAAGEFGHVLATEDGGQTWTKRAPIAGEFYPYAMVFTSRDTGWVSGLAGQVLHTQDGGRTWAPQTNATHAPLYRLFAHRGVPYGVGAGGTVARLQGDAWQAVPYPDAGPAFIGAGASLDAQDALALGGPGALLRVISARTN